MTSVYNVVVLDGEFRFENNEIFPAMYIVEMQIFQ